MQRWLTPAWCLSRACPSRRRQLGVALWRQEYLGHGNACRSSDLPWSCNAEWWLTGRVQRRSQSGVWSSTGSVPLGCWSNLTSPNILKDGQCLVQSYYGQYELSIFRGKLVMNKWQKISIWSPNTGCSKRDDSAYLKMQQDGNLVLYW